MVIQSDHSCLIRGWHYLVLGPFIKITDNLSDTMLVTSCDEITISSVGMMNAGLSAVVSGNGSTLSEHFEALADPISFIITGWGFSSIKCFFYHKGIVQGLL